MTGARQLRAVMFDMDGVLIDSEPAHAAAIDDVLRRAGLPRPNAADIQRVFVGRPDRDGFRDWFALHSLPDDGAIARLMGIKLELFAAHFERLVEPFDDAQTLARELRAHDVPLALVSGARRAEIALTLERFDLAHVFAVTVSGDDVAVGKPDPRPYLLGSEALGVAPGDCLVIEDAGAGVAAALAAGADVLVVDRLAQPERFAGVRIVPALDAAIRAEVAARLLGG